jgi:hypothetical protein
MLSLGLSEGLWKQTNVNEKLQKGENKKLYLGVLHLPRAAYRRVLQAIVRSERQNLV